jgi:hypothetical protein
MSIPTSQFLLPAYAGETGNVSTLSQLQALSNAEAQVNQVVQNGGWVIIFFHNIVPNDTTDPYTISSQNFASFLGYVKNSGVTVLTVRQALSLGKTPLSVSLSPMSGNMILGGLQQLISNVTGGTAPYSYQWIVNGTSVQGATNATWNFAPTKTGCYIVSLNVTDSIGSNIQSNGSAVNVYPQPAVTIFPASVALSVGDTQQFTSQVTGAFSPLAYQWYLNNNQVKNATGSNWTFNATTEGIFNVSLIVKENSVTAESENATALVDALNVTINSANEAMYVGQSQTFISSVSASTPPFTYQWYLNDTAIQDANETSWTFTPTSYGNFNVYLDVVDKLNFSEQSNVVLNITVYPELAVSIYPISGDLTVGIPQIFSAYVSGGDPAYYYQWYSNSIAIPGATNDSLSFDASTTGTYNISLNVADNYGANVWSASVTFATNEANPTPSPSLTAYPAPTSVPYRQSTAIPTPNPTPSPTIINSTPTKQPEESPSKSQSQSLVTPEYQSIFIILTALFAVSIVMLLCIQNSKSEPKGSRGHQSTKIQ